MLLRAFVPIIIAAAVLNGWVTTALLRRFHANPAIIAALCALVFAALIIWIIAHVSHIVGGRIDRAEEARNLAQAELVALNAQLETRVQERTAQLSEKNRADGRGTANGTRTSTRAVAAEISHRSRERQPARERSAIP